MVYLICVFKDNTRYEKTVFNPWYGLAVGSV